MQRESEDTTEPYNHVPTFNLEDRALRLELGFHELRASALDPGGGT